MPYTRFGGCDFTADRRGYVHVYIDGSCLDNGRYGAQAGIGVYFGNNHRLNVSARAMGPQTNIRAEIQAATAAITQAASVGITKLQINTDSEFVINAATQWIHEWKCNAWRLYSGKPVRNIGDLKQLDRAMRMMEDIEWIHVYGHSSVVGNIMADRLARQGASINDNDYSDESSNGYY